VTRSVALIGALRAISSFVRCHAASRFERCLVCTAKPYVALRAVIAAEHLMFAHH
jgi:hypothetical protein